LKEIAFFLGQTYSRGLRLSGLIYLHRITDPKMSGSAVKNLEIFKRLCGANAFPSVCLVTTRWNEVPAGTEGFREAEQRETQLAQTDRYWGQMVKGGSQILRHDGDERSAREIVTKLIERGKPVVLDIQREMIGGKLPLHRTSAGRFVSQEHDAMRRKYEAELKELQESKEEAIKERDLDGLAVLQAQELDFAAQRQELQHEQKGLELNFAELEAQKAQQVAVRIEEMEQNQTVGGADKALRTDIQVIEQNIVQMQHDMARFERRERERQVEISRLRYEALAQQQRWRQGGPNEHHLRQTMRDQRSEDTHFILDFFRKYIVP